MLEKLGKQAYFIYDREIEYLLAAIELLKLFNKNLIIREIYEDEFIADKKKKYPLLFEFYENLSKEYSLGILEFMLEYDMTDFSLEKYFAYVKGLSRDVFISKFLCRPKEEINKALSSEQEQVSFYQNNREYFHSYFAVEVLFQKKEWLIDTFYYLVSELCTEKSEECLQKNERAIIEEKKELAKGIGKEDPLHYSEIIMGKSFHNRGPYEAFYFMPSVLIPIRSCRWFGNIQILIFDVNNWKKQEDVQTAEILKVMSDKTRYQLLILLKERSSLNGVEIAEHMGLSTSTVSHHVTQLRNCGLIHEEPAGNTKYYSINEHCIGNCIDALKKAFL